MQMRRLQRFFILLSCIQEEKRRNLYRFVRSKFALGWKKKRYVSIPYYSGKRNCRTNDPFVLPKKRRAGVALRRLSVFVGLCVGAFGKMSFRRTEIGLQTLFGALLPVRHAGANAPDYAFLRTAAFVLSPRRPLASLVSPLKKIDF